MTLSMYQMSVPAFQQMLATMSHLLDKAEDYVTAKKIEPSVLLGSRLYPDMFPFAWHVCAVCDFVKNTPARLTGADVPNFPDSEHTFADLRARIAKTLALVKNVKREALDGTEDRQINLNIGGQKFDFRGHYYLSHFVLPNLYFHATTAYNILRHNGVDVGKRDFIGEI